MASKQATYVQVSRAKSETKMFIVNGEPALELDVKEQEGQGDFVEQTKAKNRMIKYWGRDAGKYTAVETKKHLEEILSKVHSREGYGLER